MALQVLNDAIFLIGSNNITTFTGEFGCEQSSVVVEARPFGSGGFVQKYPGSRSYTHSWTGYADFAAGGINTMFTPTQVGGQYSTATYPLGTATVAGDAVFFSRGILNRFAGPTGEVDTMAGFAAELVSDTAEVNGVTGFPLAARTATVNGSVITLAGPTAAQRLYANLIVTAVSGTTPSLTASIQSATTVGFGSPTTRATFSAQTATGWQWLTPVAGPITDGFWRVVFTIAGTTPSFTACCNFGFL